MEGTLGQYDGESGGIHLVETVKDVATFEVNNEHKLGFVTQTTLSVDDTRSVIDALKKRFPNTPKQPPDFSIK